MQLETTTELEELLRDVQQLSMGCSISLVCTTFASKDFLIDDIAGVLRCALCITNIVETLASCIQKRRCGSFEYVVFKAS